MRILAILANLDRPEAALLKGLAEFGHIVTVFVEPGSPFRAELGPQVEQVEFKVRSRVDLFSSFHIRREIKKRKIDVVHCFSSRALSCTIFALQGLRVALVAYRGTVGNISIWDPSAWVAYLNPRVDHIICVSDAVRNFMLTLPISRSRPIRIYKGHDVEWYRSSKSREDLRGQFGLATDDFVIGCVANMRRLKGVDLLIEALRDIPDRLKVRVVLVGEIRDERIRELQMDSQLMRRVVFIGARSDAANIASCFDVAALVSRRREGLPKSIIEAMAQGIPVIVSRVGGMPELVVNEVSGLVVEPESRRAVAEAILQLYSDRELCARLGVAAKERIKGEFSIQQTIELTQEAYHSALRSRGLNATG